MRVSTICFSCLFLVFISCEKNESDPKNVTDQCVPEGFRSFSATGQTLPAAINSDIQQVRFEVDHDVDVTKLIPVFDIPAGNTVYVNGAPQVSGGSEVDFSQPVTYVIKDAENRQATWKASAIKLSCKILIDASHDGGVWWFPQGPGTGYDQNKWHQGQTFANHLRAKGFVVDELGRDAELTEEKFFGYYIIIRANGFNAYTDKELKVYTNLINRGTKVVFFTDHKKYDPADELGDLLGLKFVGLANGKITRLSPHIITENISSIDYIAGSVILKPDENRAIKVLGWLGNDDYADLNFSGTKDDNEPTAPAVMGILYHTKSTIFFIGDMNGLQVMPQPFIDNLIKWMGNCFGGGGVN